MHLVIGFNICTSLVSVGRGRLCVSIKTDKEILLINNAFSKTAKTYFNISVWEGHFFLTHGLCVCVCVCVCVSQANSVRAAGSKTDM